jgi:hypothetical protein
MMTLARAFDEMPARIASLPRSKMGFPIPYFAEEVNGERDFRVVSAVKMAHAVRNNLCWVCGEQMGKFKAFVIGPMCGVNRTISDPPSHRECAIFSAKNCPFLSRPLAKRRVDGLPENGTDAAGFGLKRNPGAVGVWVTTSYQPFRPHRGNEGVLFRIGDPAEVLWFANGRKANRDEVQHSIDTGLPHLEELARMDGKVGEDALARCVASLLPFLPAADAIGGAQ